MEVKKTVIEFSMTASINRGCFSMQVMLHVDFFLRLINVPYLSFFNMFVLKARS